MQDIFQFIPSGRYTIDFILGAHKSNPAELPRRFEAAVPRSIPTTPTSTGGAGLGHVVRSVHDQKL